MSTMEDALKEKFRSLLVDMDLRIDDEYPHQNWCMTQKTGRQSHCMCSPAWASMVREVRRELAVVAPKLVNDPAAVDLLLPINNKLGVATLRRMLKSLFERDQYELDDDYADDDYCQAEAAAGVRRERADGCAELGWP